MILWKRLSQSALSKVQLNKYGSYFKFILLLSGDINVNPVPTTPKEVICYGNFFLSKKLVVFLAFVVFLA